MSGESALRLDHVPFGALDLARAREMFGRLGFTVGAPGRCRWFLAGRMHAARSCSIVLPTTYIDLIEHDDLRWRQRVGTSPLYGFGAAPSGVVFSTRDLTVTRARLAARGLESLPPYDITRVLDVGGIQPLRYRMLSLRRNRGLPFSVVEEAAPAAMRTARWLRHPNGATALQRVWLRVPGAGDPALPLEPLFGARAVERRAGGARVEAPPAVVDLSDEPAWPLLRDAARLAPPGPALLALEVGCARVEVARKALQRTGVAFDALDDGRLAVGAAQGFGCAWVFAARDG